MSRWEEYVQKTKIQNKRILEHAPLNISNKENFVSFETEQKRYSLCLDCKDLIKINQCKHCLCFVSIKTKFVNAECPLNKW